MIISVYSLVSAILFFNIGLVLIYWLRRKTEFLVQNSVVPIVFLLLLSLIRLVSPLDLKRAIVIESETVLPAVVEFLWTPVRGTVCIGNLLLLIWAGGIVFMIYKLLHELSMELHRGKVFQRAEICRFQKDYLGSQTVVILSQAVDVPQVIGVWKPCIYIPPLDLTETELEMVLKHEFQHVRGRDLWIRLGSLLLRTIFWWNPIVYFFHQEIEDLLELRCDCAVTKGMDEESRIHYLETILKVMKQSAVCNMRPSTTAVALVNFKAHNITKQRFEVILNQSKKYNRGRMLKTMSVILIVFLCSYFVIFQPAFYPDQQEVADCLELSPENAYILMDNKGELALYVNDTYFLPVEEDELKTEPLNTLEIVREDGNK